jgi:hypothetical protein
VTATLLDFYRREWPRVGAVLAMALAGGSLLAGRKTQTSLRALAVMNSIAMSAHQYEEYVDPGYFAGMVNRAIFKSDHPRNYPYNAQSAMCANAGFTALYIPPILFPRVKWLGLPPALLGIAQAFAHGILMPRVAGARGWYSPGFLTAALLHVPIGITYIAALRARGPIDRVDWLKSGAVLLFFMVFGVVAPNLLNLDKNSPYPFTARQMGSYDIATTHETTG